MNKKQFPFVVLVLVLLLNLNNISSAYFENYPPYEFAKGVPEHIDTEFLVDIGNETYNSEDEKIFAFLNGNLNNYEFILRDGHTILAEKKEKYSGNE